MRVKILKKALLMGKVKISKQCEESMIKRGYLRKDLISCIMSSHRVSTQVVNKRIQFIIFGNDIDTLPIMAVLECYRDNQFIVITVKPTISQITQRVI